MRNIFSICSSVVGELAPAATHCRMWLATILNPARSSARDRSQLGDHLVVDLHQ